jgi:hypothetical protein
LHANRAIATLSYCSHIYSSLRLQLFNQFNPSILPAYALFTNRNIVIARIVEIAKVARAARVIRILRVARAVRIARTARAGAA